MAASKFPRVFFSAHLLRQLPILGNRGKAEVQNLSDTCASDAFWLLLSSCPSWWQNLERGLYSIFGRNKICSHPKGNGKYYSIFHSSHL